MAHQTFRPPAFALRHRSALMKAALERAYLAFDRRDVLDQELKDIHGHVILPALPQLQIRPLKGESRDELGRRRADFMQAFLAVWLVQIGNVSYRSKAVLSRSHATAADPFMSLRELAELAELVDPSYTVPRERDQGGKTVEYRYRDPGDRVERVTRFQRTIGMLSRTKQNRETKPDGTCRAAGAGVRRLLWTGVYAFGGKLADLAKELHAFAMKKAEDNRQAQALVDAALAASFAEQERREADRRAVPDDFEQTPAAAAIPRAPGQPDPAIADAVAEDNPTWTIRQINDEARRLERHMASSARDADTS